jgi:hypothetical protein
VVRPDPAAYASLNRDAGAANRRATAFFDAAERFLTADRKLSREEAILTYDSVAGTSGDRAKTVDAALLAAKPCPDFYQTCHGDHPQICPERSLPN